LQSLILLFIRILCLTLQALRTILMSDNRVLPVQPYTPYESHYSISSENIFANYYTIILITT